MAARVETILAAVTTALTGLTTTGANVQRARAWPVSALPALTVSQGENAVLAEDAQLDIITRQLQFSVVAQIKAITNLETSLNQISSEVYAALVADRSLGLAYVFDLTLVGDSAAEIEAEQDEPTARQVMTWALIYEHSKTSTEI